MICRLQLGAVLMMAAGSLASCSQILQPVAANVSQTPITLPMHGVKKPKLIHKVSPIDPHERCAGTVSVTVEYVVATDGTTHNLHILKSAGSAYDRNAMAAVANYRYRPAIKNGAPVPVEERREVSFTYPWHPPAWDKSSSLGMVGGMSPE